MWVTFLQTCKVSAWFIWPVFIYCLSLHRLHPQIKTLESKLQDTMTSATSSLQLLVSSSQHPQLSPIPSYSPSPVTHTPTAVTPKPSMASATPSPLLSNSLKTELLPGDSTLPYPSPALENITDPPPRIFKEPPLGCDDTSHLKKILFWNDVRKAMMNDKK